tara:strand:- start:13913 stop:14155 length:243 start_codon:yes stop_codon:yes gene_type:complete
MPSNHISNEPYHEWLRDVVASKPKLFTHDFSVMFSVDSLHLDPWLIDDEVLVAYLYKRIKEARESGAFKDILEHEQTIEE